MIYEGFLLFGVIAGFYCGWQFRGLARSGPHLRLEGAGEAQGAKPDPDAVLVLQTLGYRKNEALRMVRRAQGMGIRGTQAIVAACCRPRG